MVDGRMKMENVSIGTSETIVSVVETQLGEVNVKVADLSRTVEKLKSELSDVNYALGGISIYLNDVKEVSKF